MHFTLVHGTTQSPEGWKLLSDQLSTAGHIVLPIDLGGLSADATSVDYVRAAVDQLPEGRTDVVVAHSGSGLLLPAIASAARARLQVFLAAVIPQGIRSLTAELDADAASIVHSDWIGVDPADERVARYYLFHDCSPPVADWAVGTLRLFYPAKVYAEVVQPALDIPAVAIVPDEDRTLRPDWMMRAAKDRLEVDPIVIPGGHCPHVSRPAEVARILTSL